MNRIFFLIANGLICIWVLAVKGWTPQGVLSGCCACVLLVIGIIDENTFEIPIECNILIGILGIVNLSLDFGNWRDYMAGMCAASSILLVIFYLTKRKGIGGGDIKMMAAAGLLLGWRKITLALFIGAFAGVIVHSARMRIRGKSRILAFGPYLSLGIFIAMLYGEKIITWYVGKF